MTEPYNLVYDDQTGNIIVGLFIEGIVVGSPDEEWKSYPVGPYVPTDFSLIGKARLMFSDRYALAALTISLCLIVGTLALAERRLAALVGQEHEHEIGGGTFLGLMTLFITMAVTVWFMVSFESAERRFFTAVFIIAFLFLAGPFYLAYVGNSYWEAARRMPVAIAVSTLGVLLGAAALPPL